MDSDTKRELIYKTIKELLIMEVVDIKAITRVLDGFYESAIEICSAEAYDDGYERGRQMGFDDGYEAGKDYSSK